MSAFSYHHTRTRDRSPYASSAYSDEDAYYTRPLNRQNSKRARVHFSDDDEDDGHDDYPWPKNTKPKSSLKPSRALTIRETPGQMEKYNVWSYPSSSPKQECHSSHSRHYKNYSDDEDDEPRKYTYSYSRSYSPPRESSPRYDEVKVTVRRPTSSSHYSTSQPMAWPGDAFKRREKWDQVEWETRERSQERDFWDEPVYKEKDVKYRRIKRTRTDEWKPLSGFRRH